MMDRAEYDEKLCNLLIDEHTYKHLPRDSTPVFEKRMSQLLMSLWREGAIHPSLYLHLRSSAGRTPLLYGLPKIYKPLVPVHLLCPSLGL